jgi:hypothetical protein
MIVSGVIMLALFAAFGVQTSRLALAHKDIKLRDAAIERIAEQVATGAEANKDNVTTIHRLRARIKAMTEEARAHRIQAEAAAVDASIARERIDAEIERAARERAAIYANDEACAAWARQTVCPAVLEQFRRRYGGGVQ